MAVHITTGYPTRYGDINTQVGELQQLLTGLIDNMEWALCNLDAGNVSEAASVRAENIDTTNAKIKSAQIKDLTADKISAGTIDLSDEITISGSDGQLTITDSFFSMKDSQGRLRVEMGTDDTGKFAFVIYSLETGEDGSQIPAIYLDDNGEAIFCGTVQGGSITSDTSIDVTTDIYVGSNIYLDVSNYLEGLHFFKGTPEKASITVEDFLSGDLRVSNGLKVLGTIWTPKILINGKNVENLLADLDSRVAALEQKVQ